ncbi:DUF1617 family protein [Carnobacteriaceae bacterium zg-ZUI78]|nr:DUF1617 family protein [Carnobacteriaceae bacterium zg-ZUI78]
MEFSIKNMETKQLAEALDKIHLKTMKASRGKSKFLDRVIEKNAEYSKSRRDILTEYLVVDEKGQFQTDAQHHFVFKETKAMADCEQELFDLDNETIVILSLEHTQAYQTFFEALQEADVPELTSDELFILDKILDQFESQGKGVKTDEA